MSVLETLAAYAYKYGPDAGGHYLRSALVAAILADRHQVDPVEAVELARYAPYDDHVYEAGHEAERLIDARRRAAESAAYGQEASA